MELLGFTIHDFFSLTTDKFCRHVKAKEMETYSNKYALLYGRLVIIRFNKILQGNLMRLSTFIDQDSFYFDTIHFVNVVYLCPIIGMGTYACYGKITNHFGFCSMNIIQAKKMSIAVDPRQ
jgi:DNA polymerase-3 subunit alpha